jgi:hypothetical protein
MRRGVVEGDVVGEEYVVALGSKDWDDVDGQQGGEEGGEELDDEAHLGVVEEGHECVEVVFCFYFVLEIPASHGRTAYVPFRAPKARYACVIAKRSILGISVGQILFE